MGVRRGAHLDHVVHGVGVAFAHVHADRSQGEAVPPAQPPDHHGGAEPAGAVGGVSPGGRLPGGGVGGEGERGGAAYLGTALHVCEERTQGEREGNARRTRGGREENSRGTREEHKENMK